MNKQKGQIMVEALIALGVAVIIMAAITSMIISALSSAVTAKNQDLATQYAKQGIEVLRNISKTNWSYLSGKDGDYCLGEGAITLKDPDVSLPKGCDRNIGIFFIRQVHLEKSSPLCKNSSRVVVSVFWSDSKCTSSNNLFCHSVSLESCLSNVNNISQ